MRLFRMTTRRWMVAVAIVGLTIGGVEMLRRRQAFALAMASHHHDAFDNVMCSPRTITDFGPFAKYADYHLKMERKWSKAARYPWLPVEPDPPGPAWIPWAHRTIYSCARTGGRTTMLRCGKSEFATRLYKSAGCGGPPTDSRGVPGPVA